MESYLNLAATQEDHGGGEVRMTMLALDCADPGSRQTSSETSQCRLDESEARYRLFGGSMSTQIGC